MTNIEFNTSIIDVTKAIVWGVIIPFVIYKTYGLVWMYVYMVLGAMLHNFVLRESTPVAYLLILEAVAVVGFYAVLALILFIGVASAAFRGVA